uniref:uncharacterized protein LOC120328814 isoform X2 n=1 Tax=Styela clava TaxID=7725 RepID=UPI00193A3EDD|nr:uncharacterized protein LOC120328814 isoform X2 [Styela clava]
MQELERLEGLILRFSSRSLYVGEIFRDKKYSRLLNLIEKADDHLHLEETGRAIAVYKNANYHLKTFVTNGLKDRLLCANFYGTIECQISFCYLILGNSALALQHANSICHDVSCQTVHVWRAFAYRRLGKYARAVKCLTVRAPLFMTQVLSDAYDYSEFLVKIPNWELYEEDVIVNYWEELLKIVLKSTKNAKMEHIREISFSRKEELHERLSMEYLAIHPAYHDTVATDVSAMRILPNSFRSILQSQEVDFFYQVTGFKNTNQVANYFNNLSKSSKEIIKKIAKDTDSKINTSMVERISALSKMADAMNCTNIEYRLLPGFGIHERLLLCAALVHIGKLEEAIQEYKCLKADIMLFIVLSKKGELKCQPSASKHLLAIQNVLKSLKVKLKQDKELRRSVGCLVHWLEDCAMRWTAENYSKSCNKYNSTKGRRYFKGSNLKKKAKTPQKLESEEWQESKKTSRKLRFQR